MFVKQLVYRVLFPIKEFFEALIFQMHYRTTSDPEILLILQRIKRTHRLEMFNYDFVDKYNSMIPEICFDENCNLFFTPYKNHRMYFKKSLNTKKKCRQYFISLFYDQDFESPHRYLTDEFDINPHGIVLDAGCAEGNFVLDNIDKADTFICVEYDEEWLEALQNTFKDEIVCGKVVVIPKMLGDCDSDTMICIDSICKTWFIDFIKMDIEGYEQAALHGAGKFLKSCKKNTKFVICTYHTPVAFDEITSLICSYDGYKIEKTKGYMILNSLFGKPHGFFTPPYIRHGVIRVIKE